MSEQVVARGTTRLNTIPNSIKWIEVPADMPGVVIFLHGVNDPGASYEAVETGLCKGVNERLDRVDLKPGVYGARFQEASDLPADERTARWKDVVDDPDTYLYQRQEAKKAASLFIPFYWGYRATPDEVQRDDKGDPTRLRGQFQDVFGNRLDRHFGKGGGFFANATNNILEMYGRGFNKFIRHLAQTALGNTLYMGKAPSRRYFI
ncbi:T6SS effector phospholipase Tle3 domain-containing protein, partial [Pseudomonas sp. M47T1]|uniref:T6SS effector phospholipase Tle3 domain-containing protein n=1 Tax=Pseudomonas sp. M47T1 TaxID=1179778 RepID=UPI0005BDEA67